MHIEKNKYIPLKKIYVLAIMFYLASCGNGSNSPIEGNDSLPVIPVFKMVMEKVNLCGTSSPYTNYEAIIYSDDGSILSRHLPNSEGAIEEVFDKTHINLMIVRDTGIDVSDKKNLKITVLDHYPVGDLGTLTTLTNTTGCICQTASISVMPGRLTTKKINLPYSSTSGTNDVSQFNTQLCVLKDGSEALLVANDLNVNSGEISYKTITNPSQVLLDNALVIDMDLEGELGREITINTSENAAHVIRYVTDQTYNYTVSASDGSSSINVLVHDRVDQIDFHAYRQLDVIGTSQPVRFWGVHVPLSNETSDIFFNKPIFEPELLNPVLNEPTLPYNLNDENQRVITGFKVFSRLDDTTDEWEYLLPSQNDNGFIYELPADYLVGVAEGTMYQNLTTFSAWQLSELPELNSLDELYQSEWLKVLLPTLSSIMIKPPAAYSYVAIEKITP